MFSDIKTLSLKIHEDPTPTVTEITHLGVISNSRLSHITHITKALNRGTGVFNPASHPEIQCIPKKLSDFGINDLSDQSSLSASFTDPMAPHLKLNNSA